MPKIPRYTKDALDEALQEINNKTLSLRAVAKKYDIPRGTLQFKLKNPTSKSQFGPTPYLTHEEENSIKEWLIKMARKGFPRKSDDVLDTVQKFLTDNPRDTPFVNNRPGQGWLKAFLKRHPNLAPRTSEGVTKSSACVSETDIKKWFLDIREYLTNENLLEAISDPQRIFNADETGFQLCPSTGRVLAAKGDKNVYAVEQGNSKENVTVLFTFSADGNTCPPLIVFPYKRLPEKIAKSVPPEWGIGRSDTGWMNADVFNQFITEIFAPYITQKNIKKPVILFIDGHKSHITLQLSLTCKELGIELIALYPNTTRITQPADVSVFGPIKKMYRKAVRKFQAENVGEVVTKLNIAIILKTVVDDIKPENIINGFRACGLCPFDENAIDYSKCLAAKKTEEITDEASNVENKLMSLKDFENIVGTEMIEKMKVLQSRGATLNSTSPTLYKVWCFFQSDLLQENSTNIKIQTADNTTTNVNLISENNVTTVKITMTPTKNPIDLCTPSTSTSAITTTLTETPHLSKSINDYLSNAPENKRKFIRKIERIPFVITSANFRATMEKKTLDKQEKENAKMERKRKRDEQAAARKENALKKTKKGKGVGKKSKNGKEQDNCEKETLSSETEIENFTVAKEESQKNVKTENKHGSHNLKILSNLEVVNCDTCRRLAVKNKSLLCSSCNKAYHRQCIPIKHQEYVPDDDELYDFICHKCFLLHDDSEPSEDENHPEYMF